MRIAVIGLGDIARKAYLPILAPRSDLEILLSTRSEASLHAVQTQYRLPQGSNCLDDVIRARPEAAFVLANSESHFELVHTLLEAGVDVFVEKPPTLRSDQTRVLAGLAERKERVLMVGFNRRFAPLHIQARQLWDQRPVGLAIFQKHRGQANHPNMAHQFIDDTIHQIDLLRFFCGEAEAFSTLSKQAGDKFLGAACSVRLANGGVAQVLTSTEAGRWSETYDLYGARASLHVDAFATLRWIDSGEERRWEESYASRWNSILKARGFEDQVDHFFDCVRRRAQPLTSAWEALKTQELLESMLAVNGSL